MFADISGFTAMSEQLAHIGREGTEIITNIVNDYFATMLTIIDNHGGDLYKFGGDAILVCFQGDQAAHRAAHAALNMQHAMTRFAQLETDQGTFHLQMKVGLGTGNYFAATLGTSEQLEFTVMGPPLINMAQAESRATAGQIILDDATYHQLSPLKLPQHSPNFYILQPLPTPPPPPPPLDLASLSNTDIPTAIATLAPYLPLRLLDQIFTAPQQVHREGEHRLVTILFANFYGIDDMITALGPNGQDELTTIFNQHFTTMQAIIHQYGGIVNKLDTYAIGYRIMAIFGAPITHEDDPLHAVQAALAMQQKLQQFRQIKTSAGTFSLKQRIGINSGYVFAGNLGGQRRQEYSVIGDEVNLAARLMGAAQDGEILISHSTANHSPQLLLLDERPPLTLKGKQQPTPNFAVLGTTTPRVQHHHPFLGRHPQRQQTQTLLNQAQSSQGHTWALIGPAGIGKSRLTDYVRQTALENGFTVWYSTALPYDRQIPYAPWLPILRQLLNLDDNNPLPRQQQLQIALDQAGLSPWAPIIAFVLGIDIPDNDLTAPLDAQARQRRFFDLVLHLIQWHTLNTPLCLILDDLHWADPISLSLIAYISRNITFSSVLLLLAHRPDLDNTPWANITNVDITEIPPFSLSTCTQLAQEHLDYPLTTNLQQLIYDRTQGIPLFIEEVVRTLRDNQAITLSQQDSSPHWDLDANFAGVAVPTTLAGLLMARLDRLDTISRSLLQVAAVMGTNFTPQRLQELYPYGNLENNITPRLTTLTRQAFILFTPPNQYNFQSTLLQEVAYESLSFARRRELHLHVAHDIETAHQHELPEYYGLLAYHFDEGRDFAKTFHYLHRAGLKAQQEFANEAAILHYQRLQTIATDHLHAELTAPQQQIVRDVHEALADIYQLIAQYENAKHHLQQALDHPLSTTAQKGTIYRKLAKNHELQGQYDEASTYLEQGRQLLLNDTSQSYFLEQAHIYNLRGWLHVRRGNLESAVTDCLQGLSLLETQAETASVWEVEADLYNTLGTTYGTLKGNYKDAMIVYERCRDLREKIGDLPGLARAYNNLAFAAWGQNNISQAIAFIEKMLTISEKIGNNYFLAFGYNNLGVIYYKQDKLDEAMSNYNRALALQKKMGDDYGAAQTSINMGETAIKQEQYQQAYNYLEQGRQSFELLQSSTALFETYRLLTKLALSQTQLDKAQIQLNHAAKIAEDSDNEVWDGTVAHLQGHIHFLDKKYLLARQLLTTALTTLESKDDSQIDEIKQLLTKLPDE